MVKLAVRLRYRPHAGRETTYSKDLQWLQLESRDQVRRNMEPRQRLTPGRAISPDPTPETAEANLSPVVEVKDLVTHLSFLHLRFSLLLYLRFFLLPCPFRTWSACGSFSGLPMSFSARQSRKSPFIGLGLEPRPTASLYGGSAGRAGRRTVVWNKQE